MKRVMVKFRSTRPWEKRNEIHEMSLGEFVVGDDYLQVIQKFEENELPFNGDYDDDEAVAKHDDQVREKFFSNLKDNWNRYSDGWTSPAGCLPIIEIVEVVD